MNGTFSRLSVIALAIMLCFALGISVSAQTSAGGDYKITSSVIAGGGSDNSTGGGYALGGTTGQAAAGGPLEKIPFYSLLAGFWATIDLTPPSFTVSGQITHNGGGLSGVNVRLERAGVLVNVVQTDGGGNYSFANVEGGHDYSVTPLKDGFVFAPLNILFSKLNSNVTANFSVASRFFSVSGQVISNNSGLGGVTLTLKFKDNLYATTVTDANGNYSFSNVNEGGPYTIEPQKSGYSFAPPTQVFNTVDADKTANFNAVLILHSIDGQIMADTGAALSGVTVSLSGSAASTVTTDQNGFYSFANLVAGGDYIVTPSKANYNFNPASATFNDLEKNETANFTGTSTVSPPASIQFELSGYTVSEGDHYKAIKVTRTGDASQSASVDYETQDITAGQRTDYTLLLGQLNFAPNETSKTLTLLVTEDSLIEGVETLNLSLSKPVGAILGNQNLVQVIITDNDDSQNVPNAIDETQNFVRQHYHDFLNREPEPGGFKGWQEILNKCAPGDTKCDRIEVSSAFYRSQEFHDRGYFIYRFYAASLGKLPKYLEFMRDMQRVSGFLSAEQQEAAKQAFIEEFMSRSEFKQKYDQLTDAGSFVDAILSTAGVQLPQREQLISDLQEGKRTRAQTLRAVVESGEVDAKFYNESFVVMQYFGYLRRDPDILYLEWIKTLDQTGDYRIMVNGFLNSQEYRERFGH